MDEIEQLKQASDTNDIDRVARPGETACGQIGGRNLFLNANCR